MAELKNPDLQGLSVQIEKHIDEARRVFSMFNQIQLNWKPNVRSWSLAQCFDHIIVSDQQYFKNIKKAIEQTITEKHLERKPYRAGLLARIFIYTQRPGSIFKFKTPPIFSPSERTEGKKMLEDFVRHEQELLVLIKRCDGWDLNKFKLSSPVHSFFKFSLGECFSILVTHQERHIRQAKKIAQLPEFLKAT